MLETKEAVERVLKKVWIKDPPVTTDNKENNPKVCEIHCKHCNSTTVFKPYQDARFGKILGKCLACGKLTHATWDVLKK